MSRENSIDVLAHVIESLCKDTTRVAKDGVHLVGNTTKNVVTAPFKIASNVLDDISDLF